MGSVLDTLTKYVENPTFADLPLDSGERFMSPRGVAFQAEGLCNGWLCTLKEQLELLHIHRVRPLVTAVGPLDPSPAEEALDHDRLEAMF